MLSRSWWRSGLIMFQWFISVYKVKEAVRLLDWYLMIINLNVHRDYEVGDHSRFYLTSYQGEWWVFVTARKAGRQDADRREIIQLSSCLPLSSLSAPGFLISNYSLWVKSQVSGDTQHCTALAHCGCEGPVKLDWFLSHSAHWDGWTLDSRAGLQQTWQTSGIYKRSFKETPAGKSGRII